MCRTSLIKPFRKRQNALFKSKNPKFSGRGFKNLAPPLVDNEQNKLQNCNKAEQSARITE